MISFISSSLNRYFCKYLLFWFFVCLVSILAIVSLFEMAELLRRSMSHPNISLSLIGEMVLLKIPQHIEMLLPFVTFSSAVLSLWRLNQTQEIVSARAAGVSVWQLVIGLNVLVLGLGVIYLVCLNPLGAAMTSRLSQIEEKTFGNSNNLLSISASGLWLRESNKTGKTIIHADLFDFLQNKFQYVSFYDFDQDGTYIGRYDAGKVTLQNSEWKMEEVVYWDKGNISSSLGSLDRATDLTLTKIQESYAAPESLSFWKITEYIEILEKAGLSNVRYKLHWHSQIAKIGLMIGMVFLACTFCLHPTRYRNASYLIAIGILSGFIIHFLGDVIYALGLAGKIPVLLAAWIPPLVTLMLSISFLLHQEGGE